MIPKRPPPQEHNVDSWLMSYADMITLLLGFFIIFVSVSEPKKDRLTELTEGMAHQFGSVSLATPFEGVFRSLQAVVESQQMLKDVAITKTQTSIETELSTLAFYEPNSAEFKADKVPILQELAESLKGAQFFEYHLTVEGHTSDVPVEESTYPSNWELSSARAAHLVRFFIENGLQASRMRAIGYAGTRPKVPNLDIHKNAIPENREKNQRVVIKLERVL